LNDHLPIIILQISFKGEPIAATVAADIALKKAQLLPLSNERLESKRECYRIKFENSLAAGEIGNL
jgi:hypothetical protein